jgi:hypothetical protein
MNKLLVFILILLSTNIMAFRYAYTTNIKTIVYADKSLDIPIGYIRSGRKIRVADNSLKNNTIVPMIVTGKIAYVKTEDLTFKLDDENILGAATVNEHDVGLLFITDQEKLSKDNYVHTSVSSVSSGTEWKELNEGLGAETSSLMVFTLGIEHRAPENRNGFAINLNYLTASTTVATFQSLTLSAEYQYRFFKTSLLTTEGFFGFHISGDAQIKTVESEISKGVLYGTTIGGRLRFLPYSKIGFYGQVSLTSFKPRDLDSINTDVGTKANLNSIGGTSIGAGVTFRL